MSLFFSADSTIVNLNGNVFGGWSDDADAISLPTIEGVRVKRGAAGNMTASSTGIKGGALILKLQPTSQSTIFMMNNVAAQQNGARIMWDGTITNTETGVVVILERGILTSYPVGQTLGAGEASSLEFTFEFEKINPDYSLANFG